MTLLSGRRYAPNKSVTLQVPILAVLADDTALNVTAICRKLGRSTDDSAVRYCLRMLTAAEIVERQATQTARGAMTYVYRRKLG